MSVEIKPSDVIRIIEQYLKENSLLRTLDVLQEETSVNLNIVDSVEKFTNDIIAGNWDAVLKVVILLKIPDEKLIALYQQIALELADADERKPAKWLIHKTEPMLKLKITNPERHSCLEKIINNDNSQRDIYFSGSKERRRVHIAQALKQEISSVPPQRLLTLLCDAIKWQKHEGTLPSGSLIDIFTGKSHITHSEEETYPTTLDKHCVKPLVDVSGLKDNEPIFICSGLFSPDGHYLVIGYSTGLVEVRNSSTGRLALDLKYQALKNYIITPSKTAALCLCFSESQMMAIGDKNGDISVWKLETGQYLQNFQSVHHNGVSCIIFRNNREILTGGHDKDIKLHGMRSNSTLRLYKGHKSFVNSIAYSKDGNFIISGSSDLTVKIWNAKTAIVVHEFQNSHKIHTVLLMPRFKDDIFLIGDRSNRLNMIDINAKVRVTLTYNENDNPNEIPIEDKSLKSNEMNKRSKANFFSCCSSPKGNWIYAVDSSNIYSFNYTTKKIQTVLKTHDEKDNDLIGIFHHPFMNSISTFDTAGNLKIWKP